MVVEPGRPAWLWDHVFGFSWAVAKAASLWTREGGRPIMGESLVAFGERCGGPCGLGGDSGRAGE